MLAKPRHLDRMRYFKCERDFNRNKGSSERGREGEGLEKGAREDRSSYASKKSIMAIAAETPMLPPYCMLFAAETKAAEATCRFYHIQLMSAIGIFIPSFFFDTANHLFEPKKRGVSVT